MHNLSKMSNTEKLLLEKNNVEASQSEGTRKKLYLIFCLLPSDDHLQMQLLNWTNWNLTGPGSAEDFPCRNSTSTWGQVEVEVEVEVEVPCLALLLLIH